MPTVGRKVAVQPLALIRKIIFLLFQMSFPNVLSYKHSAFSTPFHITLTRNGVRNNWPQQFFKCTIYDILSNYVIKWRREWVINEKIAWWDEDNSHLRTFFS